MEGISYVTLIIYVIGYTRAYPMVRKGGESVLTTACSVGWSCMGMGPMERVRWGASWLTSSPIPGG